MRAPLGQFWTRPAADLRCLVAKEGEGFVVYVEQDGTVVDAAHVADAAGAYDLANRWRAQWCADEGPIRWRR